MKKTLKEIIKEILGENAIDEVVEKLKAKLILKSDYDSKVSEYDEKIGLADKTIEELKKQSTDNKSLQSKIKEYEERIEALKIENILKENTFKLKTELMNQGVKEPDYLIYNQGGIERFEFDEKGCAKNIDGLIETYKKIRLFA